ncbi:uncharacterized protein N7515_010139 [Penicillium bovifimosum]|uniref:Uncharacterized protein n=1 Tax=Penicillium bovifimosum TaxID=126998 RepID=A0A9W9GI91_9EURO|nr:uncharacterized protein N7515_010139 [Penicillium bovifimosum]KAJ5120751.1 hypothetical protein N7515_010139 [Penicillium bovifimosum]
MSCGEVAQNLTVSTRSCYKYGKVVYSEEVRLGEQRIKIVADCATSPPLRNDSTEVSSSAAPSAPVAVERPYDPSDPDPNDNGPGSLGSRPESPPIRDR